MSEQRKRLAISVQYQCIEKERADNLAIYKLPLKGTSTYSGASSIVRRFSYGEPNQQIKRKNKTILIMGATGSGKTTWINAMINYVLGVEFDDDFRFKLVNEQVMGASQAHSQTQGITAYDIFYQNGSRIPYTLTIVDTPGFGDTQGMERDQEITSTVQQFFEHENGIKELNAVGFVVQSSMARLTASQTYIFNSVLEIFGKDIETNILFLTTFADGNSPLVLEAIKEAKLPCKKDMKGSPCYKSFNNGAIYKSNNSANSKRFRIDWEEGMANFDSFFEELTIMEPQSLQMTQEVLHDRKQLQVKLEWIQKAIPKHLMKMEELRKKETLIQVHKAKVDANQNFEIQVPVSKKVRGPVGERANNLNCDKCKVTCHHPCDPNYPMGWCEVFTPQDRNFFLKFCNKVVNTFREADCTVCPGNCSSKSHSNEKSGWTYIKVMETQTLNDVRQRYEKAKGKKLDAEELVRALNEEVDKLKEDIINAVNCIMYLNNKLEDIALRGETLSTPDYIRMMIKSEEKEKAGGFEERILSLKELLKLAELKKKILTDEEFANQFKSVH
uniref:Septin-type G domain-containing protein n=1 Tax=Daphnia galeata TaxID=27404 RepID=A0A8J2RVV7_9CRUS|nr:unnamed protein product [Daphnia galeata]